MDFSLPVYHNLAPAYAALVLTFAFYLHFSGTLSKPVCSLPLPPGPKTSWFGGVSLPKVTPWHVYAEWREIYGDIIYVRTFGNPIIILNSSKAVYDLLDKRSSIYSSRPVRTMVQELMGWSWMFSSMPYGAFWRKHRALFQKHFHSRTSNQYQPIQEKEAHVLLRNLHKSPDALAHHIRRSAAAVVMNISYGHHVVQEGDVYVKLADDAMTGLAKAGIFGTYLVDYIPLLKYIPAWMPGATFKQQAREWRKSTQAMINRPFEEVQQRIANGTARPCFATTELEKWAKTGQNPEQATIIKNVAAISYAAGADTTVSAIQSFVLAMMLYPDVQRRAQQEIDAVTGSQRLPRFSDRSSLPFVDCVVWESLRWNPVTPLGLIHTVTTDDVYEGYRIPKGTTVLPNVWYILHDEGTYPDPMAFSPERFQNQEKNKKAGINDLPLAAFGFGRRMCPGRYLAIDMIWITVASVLSAYTIEKPVDKDGRVIEPDTEYTSGLLSRPKPYQCLIQPRSSAALALVCQTEEESL
ncbi:hypothetical protein EVG20_g1513 [Dentipellis fragilis]|uniref:Cytochrome P450 n=1 Tax=Dentipellis fragilis TaxID=205917 RepID=A0A4Y9ZAB6_9AGAM|nr:hypothetical protein EVG20_g1513 [Dentipellis fragilis]